MKEEEEGDEEEDGGGGWRGTDADMRKMSGWKWGDEGGGGGRARYPDVFGGGPVRDTMGLRTEDGGALALAAL